MKTQSKSIGGSVVERAGWDLNSTLWFILHPLKHRYPNILTIIEVYSRMPQELVEALQNVILTS